MRTLLIDKKGVMYWASLTDIRDLRAGIRKPSTVLPSLEKTRLEDVTTEEFGSRVYVEFICNREKKRTCVQQSKDGKRRAYREGLRILARAIRF